MVSIFNNIEKDKSNLIKLDKDDFISLMILKEINQSLMRFFNRGPNA